MAITLHGFTTNSTSSGGSRTTEIPTTWEGSAQRQPQIGDLLLIIVCAESEATYGSVIVTPPGTTDSRPWNKSSISTASQRDSQVLWRIVTQADIDNPTYSFWNPNQFTLHFFLFSGVDPANPFNELEFSQVEELSTKLFRVSGITTTKDNCYLLSSFVSPLFPPFYLESKLYKQIGISATSIEDAVDSIGMCTAAKEQTTAGFSGDVTYYGYDLYSRTDSIHLALNPYSLASSSPSEGTPSEGTPSSSPVFESPSSSPSASPTTYGEFPGFSELYIEWCQWNDGNRIGLKHFELDGAPITGVKSLEGTPSDGTPSDTPSEGTPSEGTPSSSPVPTDGTPSDTPSNSPEEGTASSSPTAGEGGGGVEGTPSSSPEEGTPSASPGGVFPFNISPYDSEIPGSYVDGTGPTYISGVGARWSEGHDPVLFHEIPLVVPQELYFGVQFSGSLIADVGVLDVFSFYDTNNSIAAELRYNYYLDNSSGEPILERQCRYGIYSTDEITQNILNEPFIEDDGTFKKIREYVWLKISVGIGKLSLYFYAGQSPLFSESSLVAELVDYVDDSSGQPIDLLYLGRNISNNLTIHSLFFNDTGFEDLTPVYITPSEGTPSSSPSAGTPSGSPSSSMDRSEGTPSRSPSAGSPSEGTPSASPSEGTPSSSPGGELDIIERPFDRLPRGWTATGDIQFIEGYGCILGQNAVLRSEETLPLFKEFWMKIHIRANFAVNNTTEFFLGFDRWGTDVIGLEFYDHGEGNWWSDEENWGGIEGHVGSMWTDTHHGFYYNTDATLWVHYRPDPVIPDHWSAKWYFNYENGNFEEAIFRLFMYDEFSDGYFSDSVTRPISEIKSIQFNGPSLSSNNIEIISLSLSDEGPPDNYDFLTNSPSASPSDGTPSSSPDSINLRGLQVGADGSGCTGTILFKSLYINDESIGNIAIDGTSSDSPSEGTPSDTPSEGTPSDSPSEGTPSDSPSEGTPSGSPSEGTPSEGTPSDTPSASPSEGTPSEGTPSDTPSASPSEGTPSEGTPSDTPSASPSEGTPSEGTPSASPSVITSPSDSASEGTPSDTPSASPSEGTPSEGTPSEGTPSDTPSEGTPSEGTPSEGTPSGSPSEGTPSEGTPSSSPSASPSEGTPSSSASASPSEGTPSEGTPSDSVSGTAAYESPSASPSEGTPSEGTPSPSDPEGIAFKKIEDIIREDDEEVMFEVLKIFFEEYSKWRV